MNNNKIKAMGVLVLLQLGLMSAPQAAIFKCVSGQGEVFYLDKPCPVNHDEESLKHVKDPEGTTNVVAPVLPVTAPAISVKAPKGTTDAVPLADDAKQAEDESQTASITVDDRGGGSSKPKSSTMTEEEIAEAKAKLPKPEEYEALGLPADFDITKLEELSLEEIESLSKFEVE